MKEFIKKLLDNVGIVVGVIIAIAITCFSLFLMFGNIIGIIIKIVTIAGNGSIFLGIIIVPFFVYGIVQMFRGFIAISDRDLKRLNNMNESIWQHIWGAMYFPATIFGYIAVFWVFISGFLSFMEK